MKTLYLIRHAKSSWDFPDLPDYERPLGKRGEKNAPEMGRRLNSRLIYPNILVSSPAVRARETSLKISREISFPEQEIVFEADIYGAGVTTLLKTIEAFPDTSSSAFLVGHNPGITSLAEYLTGNYIGNIPTCGLACIELEIDSWSMTGRGLGKLGFFDYPKKDFKG